MRRNFFKAVSAAITYILRTAFDTAGNQSFTNGEVLDTPAEGIADGVLTNQNGDIASNSIIAGIFQLKGGSDTLAANNGALISQAITRTHGRGVYFRTKSPASIGAIFGLGFYLDNTVVPDGVGHGGMDLLFLNSGAVRLRIFDAAIVDFIVVNPLFSWTINTEYDFVVLLLTTGVAVFHKTSAASTYDLDYITEAIWNNSSPLYSQYLAVDTDTTLCDTSIPDTLYTAQITAALGGQTTGFTFEGIS